MTSSVPNLFSDLRELASSVSRTEALVEERESLDVDGPRHYALQQEALKNFKTDVRETKVNMKTLQGTVVNLQNFHQFNDVSSQLLSLIRTKINFAQTHLSQYGYEPPVKQPRTEDVGKEPAAAAEVVPQPQMESDSAEEMATLPTVRDEVQPTLSETDAAVTVDVPMETEKDEVVASDDSAPAARWDEMPEAPKTPVLASTFIPCREIEVSKEDDSVLAMELPPTPVYPEMATQVSFPTAPSTPQTFVPMDHTPTPPVLLSAVKKTLDITAIDFDGVGDGQVFHTGLTPKTPELRSSGLNQTTTSGPALGIDTPMEGRARPSSPDSQQSLELLKRTLDFPASESAVVAPSAASLENQRHASFIKPVAFVEFERRDQKLEGVTREMVNNAIKRLNFVFREKEHAGEALDLSQVEAVSLLNEGASERIGTKILLMLLKFRRLDCRAVGGQSYVSPVTDGDDSIIGASD